MLLSSLKEAPLQRLDSSSKHLEFGLTGSWGVSFPLILYPNTVSDPCIPIILILIILMSLVNFRFDAGQCILQQTFKVWKFFTLLVEFSIFDLN